MRNAPPDDAGRDSRSHLSDLPLSGAVSLLLTPVFPIALTLVYYDQRIRKEGFDIDHLMQTAGLVPDGDFAGEANGVVRPESVAAMAEEFGA